MEKRKRGFYLVFEGVVGCGKTTQSRLTFEKLKADNPARQVVWTKEPGGSEIADQIRKVVQGTPFEEEMEPLCEQHLYAASRSQTLRKVIRPVLGAEGIVVSDRSVITSMAYQGFGRGLGVGTVLEINRLAVGDIWPDKVLVINTDLGTALGRARDFSGDKFELCGKVISGNG